MAAITINGSCLRHFQSAQVGQIDWSDDRCRMTISVDNVLLYDCETSKIRGKTKTSTVFEARQFGNDGQAFKQLVALKCIDLVALLNDSVESRRRERMARYLGSEARIAVTLRGHENIVEIFNVIVCERYEMLCFAMELMDSDLAAHLEGGKALDIHLVQRFGVDLRRGMAALHDNKIIHRDVKPANLLLTGSNLESATLKLADFGYSKALAASNGVAFTLVGSPMYMAPEVVKEEPYTSSSDLWSVGAVLYEMVCGRPVRSWQLEDYVAYQRTGSDHPEADLTPLNEHNAPPQFVELLTNLLKVDPTQRMTMDQFLNHPWLADNCDVIASRPLHELAQMVHSQPTESEIEQQQQQQSMCFIL